MTRTLSVNREQITTGLEAVDAFTVRHLSEYAAVCCWPGEADAFTAWALDQLAEDPTLADMGWPALYRAWIYAVEA